MAQERERKFLLADWFPGSVPQPIVQGYFTVTGGASAHLLRNRSIHEIVVDCRTPDRRQSQVRVAVKTSEVNRLATMTDESGSFKVARGFEARVRLKGKDPETGVMQGKGSFTIKDEAGASRSIRAEIDTPVTTADALELLRTGPIVGEPIKKYRYKEPLLDDAGAPVIIDGTTLMAEIDIYSGALYGLRVVEVEFPSAEDMGLPRCPILGKEVTEDETFSNASLALHRAPPSVEQLAMPTTLPGLEF